MGNNRCYARLEELVPLRPRKPDGPKTLFRLKIEKKIVIFNSKKGGCHFFDIFDPHPLKKVGRVVNKKLIG